MSESSRVPVRRWPRSGLGPNWQELWEYRELVGLLVRRELKVRYEKTLLGVLWGPVRVLFTILLMSVIFGKIGGLPSGKIPYPIFVLTALLIWDVVSQSVPRACGNLMSAQVLLTKIWFPRLYFPLAATISVMLETGLVFFPLLAILSYLGLLPGIHAMVFFPIFFLMAGLLAFGLSLWLSALTIRYRDVGHSLPYLTNLGMLLSPVGYGAHLIGPEWQSVYSLNPLVGLIVGMRYSLLGVGSPSSFQLCASTLLTLAICIGGCLFFLRESDHFAEHF